MQEKFHLTWWQGIALIGLVFMLGELWGHTGHAVEWKHKLLSLWVDVRFFVAIAYLQYLKDSSFAKGWRAAREDGQL